MLVRLAPRAVVGAREFDRSSTIDSYTVGRSVLLPNGKIYHIRRRFSAPSTTVAAQMATYADQVLLRELWNFSRQRLPLPADVPR